jgi:hypothetical protein
MDLPVLQSLELEISFLPDRPFLNTDPDVSIMAYQEITMMDILRKFTFIQSSGVRRTGITFYLPRDHAHVDAPLMKSSRLVAAVDVIRSPRTGPSTEVYGCTKPWRKDVFFERYM